MGYELTGNSISSTYTRLVQHVSDNYYDGVGNILGIVSDASLQNYVTKAGDTMTGALSITSNLNVSNNVYMVNSLSANNGVLYKNGIPFLHNYHNPSTNGNNLFLGPYAGNFTMGNNPAQSYYSQENTGIGYRTLYNLTTGYNNLAIGSYALSSLTSGAYNIGLGPGALANTTIGSWNLGVGTNSLQTTNGGYSVGIGRYALGKISQGDYNVGIGFDCAIYIENGQDASVLNYGTYVGSQIRTTYAETNAIVIGYNAQSLGSNSVVIGNTNILKTALKGYVGIGTNNPSSLLHIAGNTTSAYGRLDAGLNFYQVPRPTTLMDVSILAVPGNVDGTHHYVYSFVTPIGETKVHGTPNGPHVFNASTNGQAALTIPISTDYRVTARKIYRTLNTTYPYTLYYLGTINDNVTTSFIDNFSDSSLGKIHAWYRPNTTNAMITVNGVGTLFADEFLTSFGVGAGTDVKANGGYINTFIGTDAGKHITTGSFNTALGYGTIANASQNSANVIIGEMAGYASYGDNNIIIGSYTRSGITGAISGNNNTVIGHSAQYNSKGTNQSHNTMLGAYAGYQNNGTSNVFIGMQAGYAETGSNKLIIDNTARASEAEQRQYALIYGEFNATPTNQILQLGGTGKVGIGTINPSNNLHISQAITSGQFVGTATTEATLNKKLQVGIYNGGTWALGGLWFTTDTPNANNSLLVSDSGNTYFNAPSGNAMYFGINNIYAMNISSSGKIAIGKRGDFANYTLDISGNVNIDGSINLKSSIYADGSLGFTGDVSVGQTMRFKNGILIQVL